MHPTTILAHRCCFVDLLDRIVHTIHMYGNYAEWEVQRWERNYRKLPSNHKVTAGWLCFWD